MEKREQQEPLRERRKAFRANAEGGFWGIFYGNVVGSGFYAVVVVGCRCVVVVVIAVFALKNRPVSLSSASNSVLISPHSSCLTPSAPVVKRKLTEKGTPK